MKENPKGIIFDHDHEIIDEIKKDPAYQKVLQLIKKEILKLNLN